MIIEPSNYTYETMPDYTDAVDGAVEIPVTGEEMEIRYAHEVVYDEAHNLHLEIFTPFQMAHPERTWPCITFIQGSAWMKQYVYQKVGMIARLAQRGYVVAIVEYRHSGIAHFPAQIIDAKNAGLEGAVIVNKVRESEPGTGFDAYNEKYVNMVEKGILDPAKVTRSALQNATSVASTLLTTESVVATIKEDAPAMPAGGAGGMGMM